MTINSFSPAAHWIWGGSETSPMNEWRYFRRRFTTPAAITQATLLVTADSRYECSVNGTFLGRGPVRGFPFAYRYDVYDLTALLCPGAENALAVLAHHIGDHTMSYIRGQAGFLCELVIKSADGQVMHVGSDSEWRTTVCPIFNRKAPRITRQFEFEEQVDARQEIPRWNAVNFDDAGWQPAAVIAPANGEPWGPLTARTTPFLTEDALAPVEVKAVELVRARQGAAWYLDLRSYSNSWAHGIPMIGLNQGGWLAYTEIIAPKACEATIHLYAVFEPLRLRVNDTYIDQMVLQTVETKVNLHAGANLLMVRDADMPSILIACDEPLQISAERLMPGAAWVFSGPFANAKEAVDGRWSVRSLDELPAGDPRIAIPFDANTPDVALTTMTQEFYAVDAPGAFCSYEITRAQPRPTLPGKRETFVTDPAALLHDNNTWTIIHPQPDGDAHLVIDFGREIIGYLRLDVDAPEGAIIDANAFEGIDDTGVYWMTNSRNSFRYVCREGRQVFQSHQRRGFRYVSLTLRNLSRPLKIRHVDTLMATYPVEKRGHFACSDETLVKIWEVAAYTVQLCMLDTYVDCPGYEQVYWVGDARNSALVNAVAFGAYDLTDHCIRLAGQSLSDKLSVIKPPILQRPHITTSHVVSGSFNEIPMWTFLWVWMAWEQYWYTGDKQALADYYVDVQECLRRCALFLTERDLLDIPGVWNLIDWAAQDLEWSGEVIGNTVLMAQALDCAAKMAAELGHSSDVEQYTALAERLRAAVNQHGWSEEYQGYVDTVRDETAYARYQQFSRQIGMETVPFEAYRQKQRISEQTNTLALLCGAVPPERHQAVLRYALAARTGNYVGSAPQLAFLGSPDQVVPVGSPWFLFFTLETLFAQGCDDAAMNILRNQWNRMLEKGATTFWETFPGTSFMGQGGHWSRSLCHGWSAGPAYFLSTQVLGVRSLSPGFEQIQIAPKRFGLSWASGTIPTPRGAVSVRWRIDSEGKMAVEYDVPNGCQVEVIQG